jgi:hypothetical protein
MSEDKDVLEQLSDLLKELPSSYAPTVSAAAEAIKLSRRIANDINGQLIAKTKQIMGLEGEARQLREDNDRLRSNLHAAELEVARLQGYQQRVVEFDPVSDRSQYEDRLPRPRVGNEIHYDGMGMAAEHAPSWYHRRRA